MQKAWEITPLNKSACEGFRKALNISPILAHLLLNRGIQTAEEARRFLSCNLSDLHDPFLLKDMERAVHRIKTAIEKKEEILIYGDYDVDGLTATALLYSTLKRYGADPKYYLPNRVNEGYGLNIEALKKISKDGTKLVIAVDCGITAVEEVKFLKDLGIDCVILDHHHPIKDALPDATAIINPLQPKCEYPYKYLASVGLVFKLAQALQVRTKEGSVCETWKLEEDLDLVALGTIADVAPLNGENRILVKHGLISLAGTRRLGLLALIDAAGIGKKKEFYTDTVAFILGPRINASGRVGSSMQSLKLLLTDDEDEAKSLARGLDKDNRARRNIEDSILKEAIAKVEREVNFKDHKVIVVSSDKWHPGVIGIVASRIVERFYRPTILVAFNDDLGKGSGRSIKNFHLFDALCECSEHLVGYGGHEKAAGITVSRDNVEAFRQRLNAIAVQKLQPLDLIPRLEIDAEISLSDLTMRFMMELKLLEPFGIGNPKPVFVVRNLSLKSKPRLVGSNTLKMWVTDGSLTYEAICFKRGLDLNLEPDSRNFSLAFTPSLNSWQGEETIQLQLKDLKF